MTGLPRVIDKTAPRDCWSIMVLEAVERLTTALRRGDPFDAQSLSDMQALQRRLGAFEAALDAKIRAAGVEE